MIAMLVGFEWPFRFALSFATVLLIFWSLLDFNVLPRFNTIEENFLFYF